jgi:hypothetical protein
MATRKTAATSSGKASGKASGKRELIAPNGDKRLIRRNDSGQIKESDDLGRSLSQDVRKPAKGTVKSGQGDKGDRARKSS